MPDNPTAERKNFFVSYTQADEQWAVWISWVLEQAGYSVIVQAWDFRPGSNFVLEMQDASAKAERTIAVMSPAYQKSKFTQPEWAAAFAGDPGGQNRQLIPVVVEDATVEGMLGDVVHINLVGLDRVVAEQKLLAGLQPGRAKPVAEPIFPGSTSTPSGSRSQAAPTTSLTWQALSREPEVLWRQTLRPSYRRGGLAALEVHLIPAQSQRLEVRRLTALADELATIGRERGLFTASQALQTSHTSEYAVAQTAESNHSEETGLVVTRSGQRGAWLALPHDSLGSVFDASSLQPRLSTLLQILLQLALPDFSQLAVAAAVAPIQMITVGNAGLVGNRSSASMSFVTQEDVQLLPDDSISSLAVRQQPDQVAEEILARLSTALAAHN